MKTFSTSILTSNELHTAATRIDEIISGGIITDPFITKVLLLLKAQITNLSLTLGRTADSQMIKLLKSKDKERDIRFVALRDYCKAMSTDADGTVATAGILLVTIIKELGWGLQNEGYALESSLLDLLIERFKKAPVSIAVTTIGATARLNALTTAQADFEDTYKNKVDAKSKEAYPKIRACRVAIARYLGGALSYIDLMAEIEGGNFKTTSDKIDKVITEFEAMARNRETRKDTEDTKQETTK
jgi:hypothetical protein